MRLTFLTRRRKKQKVLFSLPFRGSSFGLWLQVGRTLRAGRDLRRPSVQLPTESRIDSEFRRGCSGHCLAEPESRHFTTSLGSRVQYLNSPHSGIPPQHIKSEPLLIQFTATITHCPGCTSVRNPALSS